MTSQKEGAILSPKGKEAIMLDKQSFDKTRKKMGIERGFKLYISTNEKNEKGEILSN
ncbi:MAG: hypothetical protein Q6356_011895 [Candidatus Wukongarchaeota archaeon]|nr:hypothetical protein [Candidatus Wukongarchaeota archaeon]